MFRFELLASHRNRSTWCTTQHDTWTDRSWCCCLTTAVLNKQANTRHLYSTTVFPYCHVQHIHPHAHIHTRRDRQTSTAMEGHATVQTLQAHDNQPVRPEFGDRVWEDVHDRVQELTLFVRSRAAVSRYRSRESAGLSLQSLIHSSIRFCSTKQLAFVLKVSFRAQSVDT